MATSRWKNFYFSTLRLVSLRKMQEYYVVFFRWWFFGFVVGFWFGLACLPATLRAQTPDNDFQLWTEVAGRYTFNFAPLELHAATESRFDRDVSRYQILNATIGLQYLVWRWLKAGLLYRFEKVRESPDENRLIPQLIFTTHLGPIKLVNRNRFENRFFPNDYRFRYRFLLGASHLFDTTPVSFEPFVSEEIFIETEGGGFNQNRLKVGNSFGFRDNTIQFVLYYLLKSNESTPTWLQAHVLGTVLAFKF